MKWSIHDSISCFLCDDVPLPLNLTDSTRDWAIATEKLERQKRYAHASRWQSRQRFAVAIGGLLHNIVVNNLVAISLSFLSLIQTKFFLPRRNYYLICLKNRLFVITECKAIKFQVKITLALFVKKFIIYFCRFLHYVLV